MAVLAIREGKRPPRPIHPAFTEELWTLMQRCWARDSCLRPDAAEVLQILLTPSVTPIPETVRPLTDFLCSDPPVWKRLIGCSLSKDERITLISSIFTNNDETKVVGHLSGDDAQTFVDVVDEVTPPHNPMFELTDSNTNLGVLPIRYWIVLHQRSTGSLCVVYAGSVETKPYFRDRW